MQKSILVLPFAFLLIAAAVAPSAAGVNCDIVNRDLKLGRWPEDIAESMGITLADVKNCKEKGGAATADAAVPAKPGAAPKAANAPATHRQGG